MQDGMLIHIPMSRKPININIRNMAKSEVYNTDCIEYMRTLPDNHFDPMMGSQASRIAACKMGIDYVGCEIDKYYYDKGCEWFERECHGIKKTTSGKTIIEQTLFDL